MNRPLGLDCEVQGLVATKRATGAVLESDYRILNSSGKMGANGQTSFKWFFFCNWPEPGSINADCKKKIGHDFCIIGYKIEFCFIWFHVIS